MLPKFSPPQNGYEAILLCPKCENDYLHHQRVEIFDRGEDQEHGLHMSIDNRQLSVDTDLSGNPSVRRHGLTIEFSCEGCGKKSLMTIAQHKGRTEVSFE